MVKVKVFINQAVDSYAKRVEPLLLQKEACNNLMLGIMNRLKENKTDCFLGWVEANGEIIYAFLRTPPHNWILPDIEVNSLDFIPVITNYLYQHGYEVPGVLGPIKYAKAFAQQWEEKSGKTASVHMNELIYQLDRVQIEYPLPGQLIQAELADHALLAKWLLLFGEEANAPIDESRASSLAAEFLHKQTAYFLQIGENKVSMANKSRETKHGATINAVYTPDKYKKKGYATSVVSQLSQKLLNDGYQFCSLYTDLSNPTANNIYKKIGYYKIGSAIVYLF
ncbi:GNAT family N-acetyltransferase [Virgibacillus sp. M23]|uniref:GNAT family N-acetyltransferase n=1 Tax=Virgibacillus sp. M23 TaxID=3079030 RepID=UPI001964DA06|nr:GNAT family N-acetyltransferase [Virgibacillus sp. M23]QRZ18598.1 GNAT family N-acetyltransferase [Virgibacillus sp. AGTR]